eukprot:TRINITY_DN88189_c0_g1_i1.p2 TRINITY_DN88189_c0_g1~~TRINITY_DN88189_c0_g1_i1.p2  ORF type:complete len:109 (-),score=8.43 TRINITY_DN88189_c0_g1_i1:209-535(-)
MGETSLSLQINEKMTISVKIDQETVCSRSTLLKGLFESCEFTNNQEINLKLERPGKISVLLDYIETGTIGEELNSHSTFGSYINDVVYLGIQDLETHALDMLQKSVCN